MKVNLEALRCGYDTFERHRYIGQLISEDGDLHILDVGGRPGLLARFVSCPVTVTNLNCGDVISNGLSLPFSDEGYDIVTSLDVLEHIPRANRKHFIAELFRVAKKKVIFCTPFGSVEHIQEEKNILAELVSKGNTDSFLTEHVTLGLLTPKEISDCIPAGNQYNFIYLGDFRFNGLIFKIDQWLLDVSSQKVIRFLISALLNLIGNLAIYPLFISKKPHRFTNRIAIIASKSPSAS